MKATSPTKDRGAILVFALLCSAVAILGLTGWIMTVTARGQYTDELSKGTKRRMARENGRVIATRHVQRKVLPAASGNSFSRGLGHLPPDPDAGRLENYEYGGVECAESWTGSVLSSSTFNIGINRISYGDTAAFGLRTPDGVGRDLMMSLLDGSQRASYRWQARGYAPALNGDLLVIHRPPTGNPELAVTGNLAVHGRAFFWLGPASSNEPAVPTTVTFESYATSGRALSSRIPTDDVVTNYPPVANLTWASTVGTPIAGYSDVIWDPNAPGYSLKNKALDAKSVPALHMVNGGAVSNSSMGFSSDGAGAVTIDLSNATLDTVVVENAASLELKGQSTPTAWADVATSSVLIVYNQAAGSAFNLTSINLRHKNNRRVILGIRKVEALAGVALSFPEAGSTEAGVGPEWRLMLQIEAVPATIAFVGTSLNLTGGIVTNHNLSLPSGGQVVHLYREAVPLGLTTKAARRSWAEGFKLDD